jgi:hypothetical protein
MNAAPGAVVLRTEHLGRRVGEKWIVQDVSLEVRAVSCSAWSGLAAQARVPFSAC